MTIHNSGISAACLVSPLKFMLKLHPEGLTLDIFDIKVPILNPIQDISSKNIDSLTISFLTSHN